jgi:flavin-dependent dehydrogenase
MRRVKGTDLARRLAPVEGGESTGLELQDGARIAVIGGGPAGSFFSYFLLKMAASVDLAIDVDIYEPRQFTHCGPAGCNHCGGIVSETLVQIMATEGIILPPNVVRRGIDSYVVHMDVGNVRIGSPRHEERIAALFRGNGPRDAETGDWYSFDRYLLEMASKRGARVVRKLASGIGWRDGLPQVRLPDGEMLGYDLLGLAVGVNSNFLELLDGSPLETSRPKTVRTFICEFEADADSIRRILGRSMHVFLLDLPRLEFAALIPKGNYVTLCVLGENIDDDLVHSFLDSPPVRSLRAGGTPRVCNCSPLINVRGARRPYADRLVLIGDCGVTRLYKDGIGAAYRTAKAAAETAIFHGIGADDFRRFYSPTCRAIDADNSIGRLIFGMTNLFKKRRFSRLAILRMTSKEQQKKDGERRMSGILWNLFTGSAPYREILAQALHPAFIGRFLWSLASGVGRSRASEA